jgi:hypothetical protein
MHLFSEIAEHFYPGQTVKNSHFTIKFNNCDKKPRVLEKRIDVEKQETTQAVAEDLRSALADTQAMEQD